MSLDTRSLRYFVRVAEVGSISRAAKQLHIAQPALSTSLSNLEEYLNVKLFLRSAQGVTLTNEGQRLLAHAHRILEQVAAAEQELRVYGDGLSGSVVTVGLIRSVSRALVPVLFTRLQAKYPKLRLRIIGGLAHELTESLLSGDIDCAVLPDVGKPERITAIELFTENVFLLGDKNVLGFDGETIAFEKALEFPLLSPAAPSWVRSAIHDMAVARGLRVNVGLEVDLGGTVPSLVVGGKLFMIATWSVISGCEHLLKGLRIVDPEIRRTLYIAMLKSRSVPPAVQRVNDEIIAIMHELRQSGVFR